MKVVTMPSNLPKSLTAAICLVVSLLCVLFPRAGYAADPPPPLPEIEKVDTPTQLKDSLVVHLKTAMTADQAAKARLFLKDREIKDLRPEIRPGGLELVFPLEMTPDNKKVWGSLLGAPGLQQISLPVAVSVGDVRLDWKAGNQKVDFRVYNIWVVLPLALLAVLSVGSVAWLARRTTILRDTLVPQIRISDRPFSLARSQMAWWFALILPSFLLVYGMTGSTEAISSQALVLLGIASGTALGSTLIDHSRTDQANLLGPKLVAAGFTTCADVERLAIEVFGGPIKGQWSTDALAAKAEATARSLAALDATSDDPVIKGQIAALRTKADKTSTLQTYQDLIADYRSVSWWIDVVNDVNGPTVHRLQIVAWTAVLGVIYIIDTYQSLQVPQFSDNLLALMGISSGVYLGLKVPERQTT
jgi:hypothetical protein